MYALLRRLLPAVLLAGATHAADLRGYGQVTATFAGDRARFVCADAAHADILLGKLLADLFWDGGAEHTTAVLETRNRKVTIHRWPPYGAALVAGAGAQVLVVAGGEERSLAAQLAKEVFLDSPDLHFAARTPYPRYLDFYDLRAFKAYTHAMTSVRGLGLASHWPFIEQFGLGGVAFQSLAFNFHSPAPGVTELASADYEVREAERHNGLVVPCPTGGGEWPLWAYNAAPDEVVQPSPTSLSGAWGGIGAGGAHYGSWGSANAAGLDYLRRVMLRWRTSPALGGWGLYAGSPGVEMGFHDRTTELWDHSPAGQRAFRTWLREVRGLDLAALGQRWHGDPAHFKRWDEVPVPDLWAFFGELDASCVRLNSGWRWRRADSLDLPAADAPGWVPVELPPSQQQALLPWGASYYRTAFDPSDWLARHVDGEQYLVIAAGLRSPEGTAVWLNGEYLGKYKPKVFSTGPLGLKVTGLLKPGANQLALRLPGNGERNEGKLLGPVFLTSTQPRWYPFLGAQANARYVDLKEWQQYALFHTHQPVMELARALDTERPFVLSPGSAWEVAGAAAELGQRYGMGLQNTGREAYYHPWWAGLGLVNGTYGTSEASATARGPALDRLLGWILIDGDSNHDLYWSLEDYQQMEQQNGWFTQHKRLIQLFGKSLRAQPPVVVLRSSRTVLLGDETPYSWDIGRGELQAAHYDNAYASEREVLAGKLDRYPVLWDSGTSFVDEPLLKALEGYVRRGGTFVAIQATGRHTSLEPDSWPIAALTGFKVVKRGQTGRVRFGHELPLFGEWDGREFEGEGLALDWLHRDSAPGAGLALAANDPSAVALARWEDGSVAVGLRRLGQGRVIVLGSTFWRNGRDLSGVWRTTGLLERAFFDQLLSDLGVRRDAQAGQPDVWARRFVSKNGLQDQLIAYNSGDAKLTTDLGLRVADNPGEVIDLLTREPVPYEYRDGWLKLSDVAFDRQAVRIFAARRAGLARGLPTWWYEKTTYWQRCAADAKPPTLVADTLPFDRWRFAADRDGQLSADGAWQRPGYADDAWRTLDTGPWNLLAPDLKDYRGVGLYRATFKLPAAWAGRRIALGLYSFNNPIVYDQGTFYLNGHAVTTYKARGWSQTLSYDVTELLTAGDNVLALAVTGGQEFAGLGGAVWLAPEQAVAQSLDLSGSWDLVAADGLARRTVNLPGKAHGKYLVRSVDLPADWQGTSVWLHLETAGQWLGGVLVNGRPIVYNSYVHPFGTRAEVNLTPYLQPGANRLELWPYATITAPGNGHRAESTDLEVAAVRLGRVEKAR